MSSLNQTELICKINSGMMEKIEDRPTWNSMSTPKVMERMKTLYESSKWHDCVFKLFKSDGNGEELIFAHGLILASSSPVFEALCYGPMAEESPISVPDIDPLAFRIMVKFIYTDSVDFTSVETACNVLYASKKYLIYTLAGLAISYISHHINESNCLQIHEFAKFVNEERLIKESWSYLCSHLDDVLKYLPDECLTEEIVKSLVNEESLNGGELIVFEICKLWAETQCKMRNLEVTSDNLRKILIEMDLLNKIRWLTLAPEEFECGPAKSGILTDEEVKFVRQTVEGLILVTIMCNKAESKHVYQSNFAELKKSPYNVPDSTFPIIQKRLEDTNFYRSTISNVVEARKKIPLKQVYCHRFIEREIRLTIDLQIGLKISTLVTANKSIRLTGIFLNAKILPIPQLNTVYTHTCVIERDYREKMIVTIYDSTNEILFSISFSETVKYGTVFKIPLQTPVILERLLEYKIQVELFNSLENYIFGVRNSVSKFPCGLCVTFKEQAPVTGHGRYNEANDLSIISGLELCL